MSVSRNARYALPVLVATVALLLGGLWALRSEATEPPTPEPTTPESTAEPSSLLSDLGLLDDVDVPDAVPQDEAVENTASAPAEAGPQPASPQQTTPEPTTTEAEAARSPGPRPEAAPGSAGVFAEHARARQVPGQPETFYWAVVIGPDVYQGATHNTIGSVGDARVLTQTLHARGWRGDHVLTLTNGQATGANIRRAFDWLAAKTDERSTVVVSFSGHMDHRGSGPGTVAALWAHDNAKIWRDEFNQAMGAIDAGRMWISLQGCHAAGLGGPGVERAGRVITYSTRAALKSYEEPKVGMSVMGNYLFREGLAQGWGNGGNPQGVSVQGAFEWAAPRARTRTADQQDPVMVDRLGQPFTLGITPVAAGG